MNPLVNGVTVHVQSWYGTFPVCSIKGEVKKKHHCNGRRFSCFTAHLIEQDLF